MSCNLRVSTLGALGKIGVLERRLDEAFKHLEKLALDLGRIESSPSSVAAKDFEGRFERFEQQLKLLAESAKKAALDSNALATSKLEQELASLRSDLSKVAQSVTVRYATDLEDLNAKLEHFVSKCVTDQIDLVRSSLPKEPAIADPVVSGDERVAPQWITTVAPRKSVSEVTAQSDVRDLVSALELEDQLRKAFEGLGVSKKSASLAAAGVAAGFLATRWVTIQGSLASEVGKVIALAIGGVDSVSVTIPIGCLDSVESPATNECALLIGADRAPIEIFAGDYRARSISRIRGAGQPEDPYTIAICEGGVSSLNIGRVLATLGPLGPVLPCDALEWLPAVRKASFGAGQIGSTLRSLVVGVVDEEEVDENLKLLFDSNILWQSSLRRYLAALQLLVGSGFQTDVISATYAAPRLASLESEMAATLSLNLLNHEEVSRTAAKMLAGS